MSLDPSASGAPELEAEFSRLFWATRREHNRLKKKATTNDPAYRSAISFAKSHAWKWAEDLIEASKFECAGEYEIALTKLVECEVEVPNRHQGFVLFMHATALAGQKKWAEAIHNFRKAITMPGADKIGGMWNNLGGAYYCKGEWAEAINAYFHALNTPGYDTPAIAWNNLGNTYAAKGDLEESIKAYQNSLDTPGNESPGLSLFGLARIFQIKGQWSEAIKHYRMALDTPGYKEAAHAWYGLAAAASLMKRSMLIRRP